MQDKSSKPLMVQDQTAVAVRRLECRNHSHQHLSLSSWVLEEMDGHQTSDGQKHLAAHQSWRQFPFPRSFQTNKDVQQGARQHVLYAMYAWKLSLVQHMRT